MTVSRAVAARGNRLAALIVIAGLAPSAMAVDYSADSYLDLNTSHNDNIRMTESDKTAVNKYLLTPQLRLSANTETTTVGLTTLLYFNRYDKTEYDSDDQNIGLALNHQFENSSIGLNANMVRESTVTSELDTTGVIGIEADRTERYVLSPSWTYLLNDSNQVQFQATYMTQDYRNDAYTGYDNIQANLDWVHILSERLKLVASLTYSDFEADFITFDVPQADRFGVPKGFLGQEGYATHTEDKGGQLGVDYQWSEQSMLQVRAGTSKSTTTYPLKNDEVVCRYGQDSILLGAICDPESTTDNLFTSTVNWTWSNENHRIGLNAAKSTQPSSNGYTVDSTVIGSSWNFKATERDDFSATLTLRRNGQKGSSAVRNSEIADRDYQTLALGYTHRITEHWSVNAGYQYNHQKFDEADFKASSNIVSLGVRYQPQAWHWSR